MSVGQMDSPHVVMANLQAIEHDLAVSQNELEEAARDWYDVQPAIKRAWATALLSSTQKTVAEKRAEADLAALEVAGVEHEARYVAIKARVGVLETRATVNQSILKAHSRI